MSFLDWAGFIVQPVHQPNVHQILTPYRTPAMLASMEWSDSDVRITKRSDRKGVYYVVVPGTTGWRSSGKKRRADAVEWALLQASGGIGPDVTFQAYTHDFFIPRLCRRVAMLEAAHGPDTPKHWHDLRQILENYLWPRWGRTMAAAITSSAFAAWLGSPDLMTVRRFGRGDEDKVPRPASAALRNKIRVAMKHVMDQAAFEGLIRPGIIAMVPQRTRQGTATDTYTDDEGARLYPDTDDELVRIWGTPAWAAYGLVLRDTGARPSEVLGLDWAHWYPSHLAFICWQRVGHDGRLGPLKTAKTAAGNVGERRPLLVSVRTMKFVENLRPDELADGLIFQADNGRPLRVDSAGKHMEGVLERAEINRQREGSSGRPRLQYSLRHGRITENIQNLGLEAAQQLAGHVPGSRMTTQVYYHPDDMDLIRKAKRSSHHYQ